MARVGVTWISLAVANQLYSLARPNKRAKIIKWELAKLAVVSANHTVFVPEDTRNYRCIFSA
jgi:hypothetical protein